LLLEAEQALLIETRINEFFKIKINFIIILQLVMLHQERTSATLYSIYVPDLNLRSCFK